MKKAEKNKEIRHKMQKKAPSVQQKLFFYRLIIKDIREMKRIILLLTMLLMALASRSQIVRMSSRQAVADIDTLVWVLNELHPNLFYSYPQYDFLKAVEEVKKNLPDTLDQGELYLRVAPLVSALGDGHTMMWFPESIISGDTKMMPLTFSINTNDSSMQVANAVVGTVPLGAKIISINGIASKDIVARMMQYASGERYFFRLDRLNGFSRPLFHLLYPADHYTVCYRYEEKEQVAQFDALSNREYFKRRIVDKTPSQRVPDYSFRLLKERKTAVMDFRSFRDPQRMRVFADSMFTVLKKEKIGKLIIDLRHNTGGNSAVGDTLFQYIAHVPFQQFGTTVVKYSPLTCKLTASWGMSKPCLLLCSAGDLIPLRANPLRFNGKVFLLISHETFSSASDFSWAFRYFKMGPVVGEESGGMNISFGEMLSYQLPCSKLTFGVSMKRFFLYGTEGDSVHGTLPDVCMPQEQALDYALEH